MTIGEFELIRQYFASIYGHRRDVKLGIGDDAAVLSTPKDQHLVVTVDTLVQGIHFDENCAPENLAHKALAVNLSDLAAMGAEPAWVTLSLTIPETDVSWLSTFSESFAKQCQHYDVQLIGGDTCRGPLSITVQAMGFTPDGCALQRSNAKPGDLIYVTGTLGDAGAGLSLLNEQRTDYTRSEKVLIERLEKPTPRLEIGILLRTLANAAIDISDGLVQDIQHIIDSSELGAVIEVKDLPLSEEMLKNYNKKQAQSLAMTAGDDYELCFTVSPENQDKLERILATASCQVTQIGRITQSKGLQLKNSEGLDKNKLSGFDHFSSEKSRELNIK